MVWSVERWAELVDRWDSLLAAEDHDGRVSVGGLRRPGALMGEIEALENRLGNRLPPSYRSFLQATDGLPEAWPTYETKPPDDPGYEGFRPAASVSGVVRTLPFTIMLWVIPEPSTGPSPFEVGGGLAAHLIFADDYREQLRVGHLLHAVAATGPRPDRNVFLDPLTVDADGEWEAWRWDTDSCRRFRSFGDLIEHEITNVARYVETDAQLSAGLRSPDLDAVGRLTEQAEGGDPAALQELVSLARGEDPLSERGSAVWHLASSPSEVLGAAVLRLMVERPSEPYVVGIATTCFGAWRGLPEAEAAITAALRGDAGDAVASNIVRHWPEPVEQEHARTGDPRWLPHLLAARRPGVLDPALTALGDPTLDPETRRSITYTLSHAASDLPDPPEAERVVAVADVSGTDVLHLVQAVLGWGAEREALGLLAKALPGGLGAATAQYALADLARLRLAPAAPLLASALEKAGSSDVLRTLAFLDHPVCVPAIDAHMDDQLRPHALLALEQVAADVRSANRTAAADALATRAVAGDLDAARALARTGDRRAFGPLLARLPTASLSATAGLADLMDPDALPLLRTIAIEDADDETATMAAHGLVRAQAAGRGPSTDIQVAIDALSGRSEACRRLAARWAAAGELPPTRQ
jgi:hypothetical protein